MSELLIKRFEDADDVISLSRVKGQIVTLGETYVARYVHEPGWCWSRDVRKVVGTPLCQVHHQGVQLAGTMKVINSNGVERLLRPGEAFDIPPGHDACVVGTEACVSIEWRGVRDWARAPANGDRVLVSLLLTDIVDSTATATRVGDMEWQRLLRQHYERVRQQLDLFRGYEVTTTGDGLLAYFDGAARAVRCAAAIATGSPSDDLAVRAAVHTGEVELQVDGVRGLAVHITARIVALASAGEVLISSSTAALLEGSDLSYDDLGEHELKGVDGRRRIYRLRHGVPGASLPQG